MDRMYIRGPYVTLDSAVCEPHFVQCFIVRDYVHYINGTEIWLPHGTPTITPDTVPTILLKGGPGFWDRKSAQKSNV